MSQSVKRDQLRRKKQTLRADLSEQQLERAAHALKVRCNPYIEKKTCIAGYLAIRGEIAVDGILRHARMHGAMTALPVINDETLLFAPFDDQTEMVKKRFGILEPDVPEDQLLKPEDLDCILLPLVAFDEHANRMGMGGGFYDKSFAFTQGMTKPPLLIGVAHELQKADSVFNEWWDVPLDVVITDKAVYPRKNAE